MKRMSLPGGLLIILNLLCSCSPVVKSITVTVPAANTSYAQGDPFLIEWTVTGTVSSINVSLYRGDTEVLKVTSDAVDSGFITGTLQEDLLPADNYQFRVEDADEPAVFGCSAFFSITETASQVPFIRVSSPDAQTVWSAGSQQTLTWTATGVTGDVSIDLYKNGILKEALGSAVASNGSHPWSLAQNLTAGTDYSLRITSLADTSVYGVSPNFSISEYIDPTPVWIPGSDYEITWDSSAFSTVDSVRLILYLNSNSVLTMAQGTENDGRFSWTMPSTLVEGTGYTIQIENPEDGTLMDGTNRFYCGANPITVTLSNTSPTPESSQTITWVYNAQTDLLNLDLYRASDSSWIQTIAAAIVNSGSWTWTLPSELTENSEYFIRIQSVGNPDLFQDTARFEVHPHFVINLTFAHQTIAPGEGKHLRWSTNVSNPVDLFFVLPGETTGSTITCNCNDETFYWTVPSSINKEENCRIRIQDSTHPDVFTYSEPFHVSPSFLTIRSPRARSEWSNSVPIMLSYSADIDVENINCLISGLTQYDFEVALEHVGGSFFLWENAVNFVNYPSIPETVQIQVSGRASFFEVFSDASGDFYIGGNSSPPRLSLTSPENISQWPAGGRRLIQWDNSSTNYQYISLRLYDDNNVLVENSNLPLLFSYFMNSVSWGIPTELNPGNYTLELYIREMEVFETDDFYIPEWYPDSVTFEITEPVTNPDILVTHPAENTVWSTGGTEEVRWVAEDFFSRVRIILYQGNNRILPYIASQTENDGSFLWAIPEDLLSSADYKILIESSEDSLVRDYSDLFTIQPLSTAE